MSKDQLITLLKLAGIVASLYFFIVGIGAMGHAFKLFGREFSEAILTTTASPLVGLFIGVLATSLVQSSSTTTSIIVGMVAAGAISIEGAIPMIMGANVGTTVTNTLVSMGHITRRHEFRLAFAAATVHDFFNLLTLLILFPLELATGYLSRLASLSASAFAGLGGMKLGNPLNAATRPAINALAEVVANDELGKVSIVGTGMQSTPGYAARMFRTLYDAGVNIDMISTGEIRITCIVHRPDVEKAVRALHKAFELEKAEPGEL